MKKIYYLLMTAVAALVAFAACEKEPEVPTDENVIGTFKLSEIVDAAASAYSTWEVSEAFPETFKVGSKDLTLPQYQNAICQALVNIAAGKTADIDVKSFKSADHPDRDSYDMETIAVANGPKNGDETEDLVNVATRMLARMESDLKVPNQTNFTRNGSAIAFSTDRATTVISRVLANYKASGNLDNEVSAGYKGAGSSIKAFAQQYVKILDEWQKNVGTIKRLTNWELLADGETESDIVENAHYVPNDFTVQFGEKILNTADMLEIAVRSYLLLRGLDGNDTDAVGPGAFASVTPVKMSAIAPDTHNFLWNKPLIETSNGGYLYKNVDGMEVYGQVDPLILDNWAQRSLNYSFGNDMMWTNFCSYPRAPITNYGGIFSSGRALLTYAFFFKYMLDNNLDMADKLDESVVIRSELFGLETANNDQDIQLKTTEVDFECTESTKEAEFASRVSWTATPSDSWITVEPASGDKGSVILKITVAENKGDAREGKVVIKGGNVTDGLEIIVKQAQWTEPNKSTIKEFAQEYVKILDIWASTIGTIDQKKGENYEGGSDIVENAHYVPSTTTITVGEKTYNTADMLELALRSYLLIRGYDGLDDNKSHIGAGSIPALSDGAKAMSETIIPNTHGYKWGSMPYNETGTYDAATGKSSGNGGHLFKWDGQKEIHCQVDPLILDNWAQRALNWPLDPDKGDGDISNLCGYPRDPFNNYYGAFSSMRALITYAFFFKYMLDNKLDKADGLGADVIIRSELFGDEEGSEIPAPKPTIKDFAQQYVKILDVWQNTTGDIRMHPDVDPTVGVHYVPDETTITVGDKTYNTADMLELALRSYLLIRGYDGLDDNKTHIGAGSIAALSDGAKAMSTTDIPETHGQIWGGAPYNELGSYDPATGTIQSNGGHLVRLDGSNVIHCQADPLILDNWAQRALNWPLNPDKGNGAISNMCTYPRSPINNYAGSFSSKRALITYAFFFKYMLDKGLDKADGLGADVIIRSELFGDEEGGGTPEAKPTIKDFAKEYVKILDIWENTTGTIDMLKGENYQGGDWNVEGAHYVPSTTTIKVGDKTYNTADMFETALRSYLLVRGYDGNYTEKYGKDSHPALSGGAVAMSETEVPETHNYKWGENPYNETPGNGGHLVMGTSEVNEHCKVKVDILDNWAMRSLNWPLTKGAISNLCGYAGGQLAGYYGCFCAQRGLITYAFFFKYMLDNNLEKADALKDEIIRSELFGDEGPKASLKIDGDLSDWSAINAFGSEGDTRIREWKYASDADNLYFYFALRKNRVDSGRKLVIGFNTDGNEETGSLTDNNKMKGCEAIARSIIPFTNASGATTLTLVTGLDSGSAVVSTAGNTSEGVVNVWAVAGNEDISSDASNAYVELSIPKAKLALPAGATIKIGASYDYYFAGWQSITLD